MSESQIQAYLRALQNDLHQRGITDPNIVAEIESHLLEAIDAGQARGLSLDEAQRQALERFGSVKLIGSTFEKARMAPLQKLLLAIAILAGVLIAYVDSRPTWDDTGITAGSMFLTSSLLTLLGYRRPWLAALAVGVWTPLYEIYVSRNFSFPGIFLFPLLIFLICGVGAYAGWAIQRMAQKTLHPA